MFQQIPASRPDTPLLDNIAGPDDLKLLGKDQLAELAEQLRAFLLYCVGQTGGHFGAGLGVVELSIALHYVFNTPEDRLVWDVGHQAYPHKILTGRREQMLSMRQRHGLAPFPKRDESIFDTFGVGHAGTSISAALGMAIANKIQQQQRKVVAIIGDGAITAGMAYEALNHSIEVEPNLLVILNDNAMSISHNTGGMARYFARILASKLYTTMREGSKKVLSRIPHAWEFARRTEEHVKGMLVPGTLFEELGFNYIGPIDGHDVEQLVHTLENIHDLEGPQFLHIITRKGHGYEPAMEDPVGQHAISKLEPKGKPSTGSNTPVKQKFQTIFGQWLCDIAAVDERVIGITPAMREGSDLIQFSEDYPERYYDVAIAEQHAVTLAAGLACEGCKPVVAIYSTFLQRAYDQLIHDVAIQNLDVLFAIDRAGVVGQDGPTHMGGFDLSYLRCIPNLIIMAPSDENLCRQMLYTGHQHIGPAAVRYPRGTGPGAVVESQMIELPLGKARIVRHSESSNPIVILAFGPLLHQAVTAAADNDAVVVDMQFVKPLDEALISQLASSAALIVTLEDNTIAGGAGSAVLEYLMSRNIMVPTLCLGWPDEYIEHGNPQQLMHEYSLDAEGIQSSVNQRVSQLSQTTG